MYDPHQGADPYRFPFGFQPKHMSEYVDTILAADNGGVHHNSGIANHAFYLAIEGGVNRTSGLAVQGVIEAPAAGPKKNREFFIYLVKK